MSDKKTIFDLIGDAAFPYVGQTVVIGQHATEPFKSMEMSIIVRRADGRIEDFGVVSYWHKNPLKRLQFRLKQAFAKRPR